MTINKVVLPFFTYIQNMTLMQRTAARTKSLCPFLFSVPGVKFRSGAFMISLCYLKSQMGVKELSGYLKLSPLLVRGDLFAFLEAVAATFAENSYSLA